MILILKKYTSRQLRLFFLLNSWYCASKYSANKIKLTEDYEMNIDHKLRTIETKLSFARKLSLIDPYQKLYNDCFKIFEHFGQPK